MGHVNRGRPKDNRDKLPFGHESSRPASRESDKMKMYYVNFARLCRPRWVAGAIDWR
jgi:hypothetical protein